MEEHPAFEASEALNYNASTWIPPQFDVRVAPHPTFSELVDPSKGTPNFYRAAKWYILDY